MTNSEFAHYMSSFVHQGQTDKAGKPYIMHPEHIAKQVKTEDEKTVAYLHDVVEDTNISIQTIRELFGETVAEAVQVLTKSPDDSYEDYIRKVKLNPLAKTVKIADLQHNSDLSRLSTVTDKDRKRVEKYQRALHILNE